MQPKSLANLECPIAQSLDVIGDRWSLLILRDALDGFTRFDEFEANLGIAPNTLSRRLAGLVEAGLLDRRQYSDRPPRQEYVVTDRARELRPVLVALYAWGVRGQKPGARTMVLVDADSGNEIEPVLVDKQTGRPLAEFTALFAAGPAAHQPIRDRLDPESRAQRRQRNG
ncbi:MAG: helix-turn-helix domain-containing protein [Mycobacterium sp.]